LGPTPLLFEARTEPVFRAALCGDQEEKMRVKRVRTGTEVSMMAEEKSLNTKIYELIKEHWLKHAPPIEFAFPEIKKLMEDYIIPSIKGEISRDAEIIYQNVALSLNAMRIRMDSLVREMRDMEEKWTIKNCGKSSGIGSKKSRTLRSKPMKSRQG
jgi:hypothetical protein